MLLSLPTQVAAGLPDAKWAFTTRRVNRADPVRFSKDFAVARSGDLLVCQVTRIGHHKRLQLTTGRPAELNVGDHIVVACADRYAPDQFEGIAEIDPKGCDLLASGGVAGRMRHAHENCGAPTRLKPIGLLCAGDGDVINVARYALPQKRAAPAIPVIMVTGSSMNAGKTTTTTALAFGLTQAGYRVSGIKLTGTGACGDYNIMTDAGLHHVADFTDAGLASTYCHGLERIEAAFLDLVGDAEASDAEIVVAEIADGIYQQETAELLAKSKVIRASASGFMFAACDAVSAVAGAAHLRRLGLPLLAVSGRVSQSPLGAAEASAAGDLAVLSQFELRNPEIAGRLVGQALPPAVVPVPSAA